MSKVRTINTTKIKIWAIQVRTAHALLALLAVLAMPASSAVLRCADAEGQLVFTQFRCPPDTVHRPDVSSAGDGGEREAGHLSIITATALSDAEQRALADLEAGLERDRRHRARDRKARARHREKLKASDQARCAEAERALSELAETRRRGYSAVDARRFETQEKHWRRQKKAAC